MNNNNTTIYHTHHIIPRHMGGTNDPCNLIKLTVKEHAEAHRILYEKHGFEEDRLAWLALSGQVSMSEIKKMRQRIGQIRGAEKSKNIPNHGIEGGLAVRDRCIGIHDPNNIHWKKEGGKKGIAVVHQKMNNSKWMNNGMKDTRVAPDKLEQYVSNGWKFGRLFSANKGKTNITKNLFWINKNGKNKRVPEDQVKEFLSNGWSSGMFMN